MRGFLRSPPKNVHKLPRTNTYLRENETFVEEMVGYVKTPLFRHSKVIKFSETVAITRVQDKFVIERIYIVITYVSSTE